MGTKLTCAKKRHYNLEENDVYNDIGILYVGIKD